MSTYQLKNTKLATAADWMISPATLSAAQQTLPAFQEFYDRDGDFDIDDRLLPLKPLIGEPVKEVYTVPIFSEEFVSTLRDEIDNMRKFLSFNPNPDEDELRQIPEIILADRVPELHWTLMEIVREVVDPITLTLWAKSIDIVHVQIANYNPTGKRKGAWHHDLSSDITIVVPLNTGEYVGGGTEFFQRGIVPPLPNGHGLIFPGLTHLHRGLAVEEGDRYLLVFWLKCEKDDD